MLNSYHIRQANPADAALLSRLGGETFYDAFIAYNREEDIRSYIAQAYHEEKIKENLEKDNIVYFISFIGEQAAGYLKLIRNVEVEYLPHQKVLEIEKIYSLKEYIGRGAGKALMQQAIVYAKAEGFDTLFLGVWEENHRAVNFYKNFGFIVSGHRQFQLGERICDDYLMTLAL